MAHGIIRRGAQKEQVARGHNKRCQTNGTGSPGNGMEFMARIPRSSSMEVMARRPERSVREALTRMLALPVVNRRGRETVGNIANGPKAKEVINLNKMRKRRIGRMRVSQGTFRRHRSNSRCRSHAQVSQGRQQRVAHYRMRPVDMSRGGHAGCQAQPIGCNRQTSRMGNKPQRRWPGELISVQVTHLSSIQRTSR